MDREVPTNDDTIIENQGKKFEFTARALSKLPPPIGVTRSGNPRERDYYYDSKSPGLQVARTNEATTFYTFYWSPVENKPIRIFIGRFPGVSLDVARKLNQTNVNRIVQGHNPAKEKRRSRDKLTVGAALSDYLSWLRLNNRKETSLALFEYLSSLIKIDFGLKPLDEVTPESVVAFRNRLVSGEIQELRKKARAAIVEPARSEPRKKSHSGPARKKGDYQPNRKVVANRTVRLLSQTYNYLAKMNIWDGRNPCAPVKPFPEQPSTRRLEDDELKKFIATCGAIRQTGDSLIPEFLLTCLFTGIRRRNVSSAQWNQLDLAGGIWSIPETKNGLPVPVYLAPYLLNIFRQRRLLSTSEWVFPAASRTGHLEEPLRGLYRVLDQAGINKDSLSIHSLKHTFVSYAYEVGLNPIVITRMGGHKIREITARYGHASDKALKEGYIKVADHMLEVAGASTKVSTLSLVQDEVA